jgi:hypothetical protein
MRQICNLETLGAVPGWGTTLAEVSMFSDNDNIAQRVQDKLGEDLPQAMIDGMQGIKSNFLATKQQLGEMLSSGKISQEDYGMHLNTLITHAHNDLLLILGNDRLQAIFGDAHPIGTIDKDKFADSHFRSA